MAKRSPRLILLSTIILVPLLAVIALGCGRISLSPVEIWTGLTQPSRNPAITNILYTIRLPRILGALLIGAGLAAAGSVFQNPLVSPDILGVSYGAAVGAAIAILAGGGIWPTQLGAFVGGIIAVVITLFVARILGQRGMLILVLSGIVISGFMQAILGLLKYIADPDSQLQSIVYWQLGSLAKVDLHSIAATLPALLIGGITLGLLRWHLTVLSLGDHLATSTGLNVRLERLLIIVAGTLLTAATVCLSGNIGWVGLVIPHMARRLVGTDERYALPLSALVGALFLLLIDTLARTISAGEIPLSILTGFIGAPLFIYLLIRKKAQYP